MLAIAIKVCEVFVYFLVSVVKDSIVYALTNKWRKCIMQSICISHLAVAIRKMLYGIFSACSTYLRWYCAPSQVFSYICNGLFL